MELEVRPLRKDDAELEAAFRLDQQAFNVPDERRAFWSACVQPERMHGAFVDGRLAAMSHTWAMGQYFGGRAVPMGGVGSVAVAPEHRGRGLARRVMGEQLRAMRERGEVISALYPATSSLYRGVGYELAGACVWHQVSGSDLRAVRAPEGVAVRRLEDGEDLAPVRRCYERVAPEINGWVRRDDWRWQALAAGWREERHYLYVAEDARGAVQGLLAYRHEPTPPGASGDYGIRVNEIWADTPDALRAFWRTLGSSSAQADAVTVPASPEDALLLMMAEQRSRVRAQVRWMLRVVDAPGAVAARGYAPGLELEAPLVLDDPLLPENAGAWTLHVTKGEGRLERGGRGGPRLGVGAFASLYSGWADAATLARAGLLHGGEPAERRALSAAFAGPTPWMIDQF